MSPSRQLSLSQQGRPLESGENCRFGAGTRLVLTTLVAFLVDSETLQRAALGDTDSLSKLVLVISPQIERQLLRYPVAEEDRRDLLQATLMQVVRRLGSFRGDSSFSTWLFRVTANEALMLMRSQRRLRARLQQGLDLEELARLPEAYDDSAERGDAGAEANERRARLETALASLPNSYRNVVTAHYHDDLNLQEIADQLAITESAVRSRLHRARSRLRTLLQDAA